MTNDPTADLDQKIRTLTQNQELSVRHWKDGGAERHNIHTGLGKWTTITFDAVRTGLEKKGMIEKVITGHDTMDRPFYRYELSELGRQARDRLNELYDRDPGAYWDLVDACKDHSWRAKP